MYNLKTPRIMILTITDFDEISVLINLRPFQLPPYSRVGIQTRENSSTIQLLIEESVYQSCIQAISDKKCCSSEVQIGAFAILHQKDLQKPAGRLLLEQVNDVPVLIVP